MMSIAARLEAMTMPIPFSGCVIFLGVLNHRGYGRIWDGERMSSVHRVAYELAKGAIPEGYQVDHKCRVLTCCNPAHLEAVTPYENFLRSESITRQYLLRRECPRGHSLIDPQNVIIR